MRLAEPNKVHRKSGFEQALSLYDLPRNATVQLISRSENETYKVEARSGQQWALRVQRPGYQSKNTLASEIAWLVALRQDGVVATPVPIAGLNGEWIQVAQVRDAGAQGPPDARNMVLFAWEEGRQPAIEMDLRQCFKSLGAITAKMHAHSSAWQRPEGFERFTWDFEAALGESPRWGRWRDGLGMDANKLRSLWPHCRPHPGSPGALRQRSGSLRSSPLRSAAGQSAGARRRGQSDRLR